MKMSEYSKEQIEQKRLLALQRRNETLTKQQTTTNCNSGFSKRDNSKFPSQSKIQNATSSIWNPFINKQKPALQNVGSVKQPSSTSSRYQPIEPRMFFGSKPSITGKCSMIAIDRFVLETSSFVPAVINIFKSIPSSLYDSTSRTWNFHIKDYESLLEKLTPKETGIQITGIPKTVLQMFRKYLDSDNNVSNIDLSQIEKTLVDSLMPFQREGVCYGILKGGRCIIADDMGLGKTIQALGIAHYFKHHWPLLIVAPSFVRYQWSEAIYNFLPSIPIHYIQQFINSKDFIDEEKITIISYDLLARMIDTFEKHAFRFVILDESHVVKSHKTARFKAVQRVTAKAQHVILLSGTPALSRPVELYSQISLVFSNFMPFREYGIRYCDGKQKSFGWDFSGSSNMQELQLLLKVTCMIRRLKSEVLNQLPSKMRQVVVLDPALIKAGTKEMEEMARRLEKKVLSGVERHNALLQYYNESSIAKLKAICDYVSHLLETKRKCIIYAHHQNVMDAVCNVAEEMRIRYIRIDGRTNPEQRKNKVDKFQESDEYLLAVLSITAANAGVTLTAARLVVFAELFWNPGILCQAEDRVHRIGQNSSVLIQYLVARNTADDHLWPLIQRKLNVLNAAGLDQNFTFRDAEVTNQPTSKDESPGKRQLRLDFFLNKNSQENTADNQSKSESLDKGSDQLENGENELLEIDDLNFCEWDDDVM